MKETDIINAIRTHLKSDPEQQNRVFESDAEIVKIGGQLLAFTTDDFSEEDVLSTDDPKILGYNLAAATISDLLAVGATPECMMHSLVVCPEMNQETLKGLSAGIQEALDEFGAAMLGGDVGLGGQWRYTGFAIGSFRKGVAPLSRKLPINRGMILATGDFGDANLAAVTGTGNLRFECRLEQSTHIAQTSSACIDTSDGLVRAMETISELNSAIRFVLDLDQIPYASGIQELAASLSVRPEALLFGSAGEYELLPFVSEAEGQKLLATGGFTKIGTFSEDGPAGIYYHTAAGELISHIATPDPREMKNTEEYCAAIISLTHQLFG